MEKIKKQPEQEASSRLRGEGPEFAVLSPTAEDTAHIDRFASWFIRLAPFFRLVVKFMCRIEILELDLEQSPKEWWREFRKLLLQPANSHKRLNFMRIKGCNSARKLWIMIFLYIFAQNRRAWLKLELRFKEPDKAIKKLGDIYETIQIQCALGIEALGEFGKVPGLWPKGIKTHISIMRDIGELAEKGILREVQAIKKLNSGFFASADALLLCTILYGCGSAVKATRREVGWFGSLLNQSFERMLGTVDDMPVQPVMKWVCLAEQAAGCHPRSDETAAKAARSFSGRVPLSDQLLGLVYRFNRIY